MIEQQIEQYVKNNKWDNTEHRETFYPSLSSCDKVINKKTKATKPFGHCLRSSYYSCIGLSEKTIPSSRTITRKLGDYTEYMLLSLFEKNGILVEKGTKFLIESFKVSGKIDAIVKIDDCEYGVEIKSISSSKWTIGNIFGTQYNQPTPNIEHLLQCMIYLYAMIGRIDTFYLVYIRRDNGEIKEFEIKLALIDGIWYPTIDGKVIYDINCNNVLSRFAKLADYIETDTVPPRDYHFIYPNEYAKELNECGYLSRFMYNKYVEEPFGDFECSSCGYKDMCIKDGI